MQEIIIGKEGRQPFTISDPKVSRRHAILRVDPASRKMEIIDNNSTNGTYIYNGSIFVRLFANQPYEVTPDTMIQLGPDTRFHVRRLLAQPAGVAGASGAAGAAAGAQGKGQQKPQQPKQPKKIDIRKLRTVSDSYTKNKLDLESKFANVTGLRSLTILVTLAAGGASGMVGNQLGLGEDQKGLVWAISIAIAGVLMALLLMFISKYSRRIKEKLSENERNYQIRYCCPECHFSFCGKIYENVLASRKCPKCGSLFFDSSQAK